MYLFCFTSSTLALGEMLTVLEHLTTLFSLFFSVYSPLNILDIAIFAWCQVHSIPHTLQFYVFCLQAWFLVGCFTWDLFGL